MFNKIEDLGFSADQITPGAGWHCAHLFYSFDRKVLAALSADERAAGKSQFQNLFDSWTEDRPQRMQSGLVVGHKADFSIMMMDPDPIKLESVNQYLLSGPLGAAMVLTDSYISISEVSEYVQSVEQYAEKLQRDGEDPGSSAFQSKLRIYGERLEKMNVQRLTPSFPEWPVSCFYPMNKSRLPGANWFSLSSSERNRLMAEHAHSGIKFAGKVSQLITVSIGLDNWEWGVTLWATNPFYLKQIVYEMRFDEASARFGEFGPFYTIYRAKGAQILEVCRV